MAKIQKLEEKLKLLKNRRFKKNINNLKKRREILDQKRKDEIGEILKIIPIDNKKYMMSFSYDSYEPPFDYMLIQGTNISKLLDVYLKGNVKYCYEIEELENINVNTLVYNMN